MEKNATLRNAIGAAVYHERTAQNLTQSQLAELAGLHTNYIGQVERGKKDITVQALAKICIALGYGLVDFFEQNKF